MGSPLYRVRVLAPSVHGSAPGYVQTCITWTSMYSASLYRESLPMFKLFHMKHIQLASYWNALLLFVLLFFVMYRNPVDCSGRRYSSSDSTVCPNFLFLQGNLTRTEKLQGSGKGRRGQLQILITQIQHEEFSTPGYFSESAKRIQNGSVHRQLHVITVTINRSQIYENSKDTWKNKRIALKRTLLQRKQVSLQWICTFKVPDRNKHAMTSVPFTKVNMDPFMFHHPFYIKNSRRTNSAKDRSSIHIRFHRNMTS